MEIGGEKMRNSNDQQGENERPWNKKKKTNRNISSKFPVSTYDISYIRCVTTKFYVVVVQNNVKEIAKNMCCKCKVFFFLPIRPIDFLAVLVRSPRLLALQDFILI